MGGIVLGRFLFLSRTINEMALFVIGRFVSFMVIN